MSVSKDQLIDFIYEEARMLDEGRYTEWLDLWLPNGHYWMPLDYKQSDPINQTHLFHIIRDLETVIVGGVPFRDAGLAAKMFPDE